jgi:hypothetical protein
VVQVTESSERELLREVAASGVAYDAGKYLEVQIDRATWDSIRALAASLPQATTPCSSSDATNSYLVTRDAPTALPHPVQNDIEKPVPRWITSWPDWYGIHGNVQVVPASDYDVLRASNSVPGVARVVDQFESAGVGNTWADYRCKRCLKIVTVQMEDRDEEVLARHICAAAPEAREGK